MKTFGPVEIHYGKVQQKVTLKYDSWHKEILSRFGGLLGENMHEFHGTISKVSINGGTHVYTYMYIVGQSKRSSTNHKLINIPILKSHEI